jgi:hypothetical protein
MQDCIRITLSRNQHFIQAFGFDGIRMLAKGDGGGQ